MRFLKFGLVVGCVLTACAANAAYQFKVIFNNGAERELDQLVIQDDKLVLTEENISVPFSQIKSVNFTFDNDLTQEECNVFLTTGAYEEMIVRIDELLSQVKDGLSLPGNIDFYLQNKMRACFWAGKYDEMQAVAEILKSSAGSYSSIAEAYTVLVGLEQGQSVDELSEAYSKLNVPGAMNEYIQGRFAIEAKKYEDALQYFANVLVFYSRDPEWAPASTFFEAKVYKKIGYLEAASSIATELEIAYPDSYWGVRASELR